MACVDPSMPLDLMVYLGQSDFWGMPMKFCVSFPLVYHFMGAIRHTVRRTLFIPKKPRALTELPFVLCGTVLGCDGGGAEQRAGGLKQRGADGRRHGCERRHHDVVSAVC